MALRTWFEAQLARLPPKGGLAQAIRYALGNWTALVRYADNGRLEIDTDVFDKLFFRVVAIVSRHG
jgi:hypothetical protein